MKNNVNISQNIWGPLKTIWGPPGDPDPQVEDHCCRSMCRGVTNMTLPLTQADGVPERITVASNPQTATTTVVARYCIYTTAPPECLRTFLKIEF